MNGPGYSSICRLLFLLFIAVPLRGQEHFNVTFRLDFASVDALLEFSEGRIANVDRVASLRGNQIAAATSALLAREPYSRERFAQELERFRNGATAARDMFGLSSAIRFRNEIRTLSQESKKRALERRVMATIAPFFPEKARLNAVIPVYFVAMGNENAAAFVRSIVWRDDVPYFVGEGEGELTVVMNLTRSVEYIRDVQVQFIDMMSTLAHESFHAVFGLYQQQQPVWQQISSRPEPHWILAELVQNEGIAYLISLQQRSGAQLSAGQLSSSKQSVADLNAALNELASPQLTRERARDLIMNSNLSGSYEKNYGASAGVLMAYAIDAKLGRKALTETLELGPADFFSKYQQLAKQFGELPQFEAAVIALFR
ncbi:MAG: hypothetical protein HUU02_11735 [Bacteroidetes bacterium]|nr:hypothetical protein [Bacteroidota bacterium]